MLIGACKLVDVVPDSRLQGLQRAGAATHTFEGLCNEPDMETPYSYAYAGRADRVQEVVTAVKTYSYAPGRGGLAGNDDSGGEFLGNIAGKNHALSSTTPSCPWRA